MDIGWAVKTARNGVLVTRTGWNGRGMHVAYCGPGYTGEKCDQLPYLIMTTADGRTVPWTASQTDLLAEDWEIA